MKRREYEQARVPITYVMITIEQAAERGIDRNTLLEGLEIDERLWKRPDARIPLLTYGRIVARTLRLSGDEGLGYDFGLRTTMTSHGFLGFGFLSQQTLGEALALAGRFMSHLRSPGFTTRLFVESGQAVIEVREAVPYGPLRQYAFDMVLVGLSELLRQLEPTLEIELWFDSPEPAYYAKYRDRLPRASFSMAANQLRIPAASLELTLQGANPSTAQLVVEQCEEDLARLGTTDDILAKVRALLARADRGYLSLDELAAVTRLSSRTLKRKLREHGLTYRQLLDEARSRDSVRLLQETTLPLDEVAYRVGYSETSNFCRAFRRWTGKTPGQFR